MTTSFLDLLAVPPDLLALGEPTHGESAFLQIRNDAFATLAERGYRSIAVESDRSAGLVADEFVQGAAAATLDRVLAEGSATGSAPRRPTVTCCCGCASGTTDGRTPSA